MASECALNTQSSFGYRDDDADYYFSAEYVRDDLMDTYGDVDMPTRYAAELEYSYDFYQYRGMSIAEMERLDDADRFLRQRDEFRSHMRSVLSRNSRAFRRINDIAEYVMDIADPEYPDEFIDLIGDANMLIDEADPVRIHDAGFGDDDDGYDSEDDEIPLGNLNLNDNTESSETPNNIDVSNPLDANTNNDLIFGSSISEWW